MTDGTPEKDTTHAPQGQPHRRSQLPLRVWRRGGQGLSRLEAWTRKRPARAVLLAVLLGLALIFLGVWRLPELLVNEKLVHGVDRQKAYNDARTPVGVVLAGTLAAIAAGLGVYMNHRTVGVARDNLQQAKDEDRADRQQWREEQYAERFKEATNQLSSESSTTRLAGVVSLALLGDDWKDRRQACVRVLCSYYRISSTRRRRDKEEQLVRATIIEEIARRTNEYGSATWWNLEYDFSGADLTGVNISNSVFAKLIMEDVILDGTNLWNLTCNTFDLSRARWRGFENVVAVVAEQDISAYDMVVSSKENYLHLVDGNGPIQGSGLEIKVGAEMVFSTRTGAAIGIGIEGVYVSGRLSVEFGEYRGEDVDDTARLSLSGTVRSGGVLDLVHEIRESQRAVFYVVDEAGDPYNVQVRRPVLGWPTRGKQRWFEPLPEDD